MAHVSPVHIVFSDFGLTAALRHRKGKSLRRPLPVRYLSNLNCVSQTTPIDLLRRWAAVHPQSAGFFHLDVSGALGTAKLSHGVDRALALISATAPPGFYFGSHNPRIGGFNELLNLQFTKMWIMQRMDWASESMFQVYFDKSNCPHPALQFVFLPIFALTGLPSHLHSSLALCVRVHMYVCW